VVDGTAKVTGRASDIAFLMSILPAYFADFWQTVAERGPIALDVTYDPARKNGEWDGRGRLGDVDVPTLVISGRYDFVCPRPWSAQLHQAIPDARLLELDESGHFGHLERQRDEFVRAVAEFVS
jgi:proline iminopeptidase